MNEERQAIIHLLDKQARYEYAINNDLSFNDEDYEAYIIRQSMIKKDNEIERQKEIIRQLDIKNLELTTILKEAREYINKIPTQPVIRVFKKELLEILDKENNNE